MRVLKGASFCFLCVSPSCVSSFFFFFSFFFIVFFFFFCPPLSFSFGSGYTYAELDSFRKNLRSFRSKALHALADWLLANQDVLSGEAR